MKTIFAVLGVILLIGVFAYPALSNGTGWGRWNHMWDFRDGDYRHGHMYDRGYGNLNDSERNRMEELDRKYYTETEEIRNQIMSKSEELDALLESGTSDPERIKAVQRELSGLRSDLDQKGLEYEMEARKIVPENRLGRGYDRGYHRGYWGRGTGMGYGPGACWR